jgi:hypothetical protein
MLSPAEILYIIMTMLSMDNATASNLEASRSHLEVVATSISKHQTSDVPATRLIALAYNESRFGYREAIKGTFPKSGWGACGIYQQLPRYAEGGKTTCKKLGTDIDHATMQAVAYTRYMSKRWKPKTSKALDDRFCHYYSGNKCDAEAHAYAKRHRKARLQAIKLAKSKKRIALKSKGVKRLKRVVVVDTFRADIKSESKRAKMGLPPLTL